MNYFKPYEGTEPYIFVSYAHSDSKAVMEVLNDMHARGYRIWYDEGIEVGSEWPECIAQHLRDAHLVLAFISGSYMKSDNCRREMHYALMKRIKVINIFLESTEMTPGMEMQIGNIFALMKYCMPEALFYEKLYSAPLLISESFTGNSEAAAPAAEEERAEEAQQRARRREESKAEREERRISHKKREAAPKAERKPTPESAPKPKPKKKWTAGRIIALVLAVLVLAAVITLGIVGHFTGLTERVLIKLDAQQASLLPASAKAEFSEDIFEKIAREYSGIENGDVYVADIAGLTELYICGGDWYFSGGEAAGAESTDGGIRDLSDLRYFTGLKTLTLTGQSLSTLSTMPALDIQYLDISGCRVSTLDGVGRLSKLRELRAAGCPVTELGDIRQCLELRLIDLNGASVTDYSALKPLTKLTSASLSNCTTDEMKTVLHMSGLTEARFTGCDLRGSFFRSFDREKGMTSLAFDNCKLDSTANLDEFDSLTTLTLLSSGENLDWSALGDLPALSVVNIDAPMETAVTHALNGTGVTVNVLPDDEAVE